MIIAEPTSHPLSSPPRSLTPPQMVLRSIVARSKGEHGLDPVQRHLAERGQHALDELHIGRDERGLRKVSIERVQSRRPERRELKKGDGEDRATLTC
jgi:hypothetical protein